MRSLFLSVSFLAATLGALAHADAKPRRVVVAEFDGPRKLADSGRSAVLGLLGEQYNIVATKNWDNARSHARGRGPEQWRGASKQAGVDAVIEGWVQTEGRHQVLTLAVLDAATGRELDTVTVRIKDDGIATDAAKKLSGQLDDVMSWIDGDINAEPAEFLPRIDTRAPALGARNPDRNRRTTDDDAVVSEDDARPARGRTRVARDEAVEEKTSGRIVDLTHDNDEDPTDPSPGRPVAKQRIEAPAPTAPAYDRAASDDNTLVNLFGPESEESKIIKDPKAKKESHPTPRFAFSAGPYLESRGMTFSYDPGNSEGGPPDYPAQTLKGISASAAIYPMPLRKVDGDLSGLGFTFDVQKSVASVLTAQDETGYGDSEMNHTAWATGVHYRYPIEFLTFDAGATFGNLSYKIIDLPESVAIPDTSYSYLGLSGHMDLKITEHSTVGFGASYMYLLGAGDMTDQSWYGAGSAAALGLSADVVIPITNLLYLKADLAYKRVKVDFEGSGELAMDSAVWSVVDSSIGGAANLGVKF